MYSRGPKPPKSDSGSKCFISKFPHLPNLSAYIFLILIFCSSVLSIETETDRAFIIKSIEIQGSQTMPSETVLGILQTRIGDKVSSDTLKLIRDDVKELYKLGQFSNVCIDSVGSPEGITLTFVLEEWPKVSNIEIAGNNQISSGKINEILTIAPNRSLSGKLLHENEVRIISLYKKKGYYLTQMELNAAANPDGTVNLSIVIKEGSKVEVSEIDIVGNRRISDKDIRKQMKIKQGKRFDDDYFEGDLKTIRDYYYQNGFLNAKVISFDKEISEDKIGIIVRIELEEGPQFRIGCISVQIQPHEDLEQLFSANEILKKFAIKEGDIFTKEAFEGGLWNVQQMYNDQGRVFTNVNPDTEYNSSEEIVDITLNISEGGMAYIDKTIINWTSETSDEPHKTKEYVIRRELDRLNIKEGELFAYQNMLDARRRILTLGSFIRGADPQPQISSDPSSGDQKISVIFDINESRQSGMFSIAGGYGTEGEVFGSMDIWDDNIFGRAWRLHLKGEIGTKERRTGQLYFSTPWVFNTPTSLTYSIYNKQRSSEGYYADDDSDEAIFRDKSIGMSVTAGRPLTHKINLFVGLRDENVSYQELMGEVWEETYKGKTRSITFSLNRDTRQFLTSMFDPNAGTYNTASAEFSGLGGDEFQKYTAESSIFIPTWWKLVLVLHSRAGYISGKYPEVEALRYERFYLGGMDTIRGYGNYSIVPPGYEENGGNQMALLNVEYRFPIYSAVRGLVFFDMGQTWGDNEWPWERISPRKSIGAGVRLDLMGALARLEYAIPLDSTRGGQFLFDIGPAF